MENTNLDPVPAPPSSLGLPIASLVLGILAVVLSFLLLGGVLGLIGVVLGLSNLLKKRNPTGMARWGTVLSVLGLIASLCFAGLYYSTYKKFSKIMESASQSDGVDLTAWEGVMAPDISVKTLDGGIIKLSDLKGRRVVLDFWATWCPPCRKEIPHFIQLASQTSTNDLVIVGISSEDAKILGDFVSKQSVNYSIGSAVNELKPYADIKSIPTTFFIDRHGVIQKVAIGYHEFKDLKEFALGPDYAGTPKSAPASPPSLPDATNMLKSSVLWTNNIPGAQALCVGDWDGNGNMKILVAAGSTLHVLDLNGTETTSIPLPARFALIECGRNLKDGARLLGYENWGHAVTVVDHAGKKLWEVSASSGVDGAHWGDLQGDGTDEMVVGMNGGGGLQAWSADGKKLWSTDLGNVWNQAIVPAISNQPAMVMATEAGGTVKVFDAQGSLQRTLRPEGGYYAQMAAARTGGNQIQIMAINGDKTVAFDETGRVAWTTSAIGNHAGWRASSFAAGDLKGDGTLEWAFIDGASNLVIATASGQKISSIADAKHTTAFAIAARPGKSGVLVTLGNGIVKGYNLQP